MSKNQVLCFIGRGLLVAGLLIFLDATSNQYILNDTTFFGYERMGPPLFHEYVDRFNQQQLIGGFLAMLGTGLAFISLETHTKGKQDDFTTSSNATS